MDTEISWLITHTHHDMDSKQSSCAVETMGNNSTTIVLPIPSMLMNMVNLQLYSP